MLIHKKRVSLLLGYLLKIVDLALLEYVVKSKSTVIIFVSQSKLERGRDVPLQHFDTAIF